jgi:predicted permease
MGGLDQRKEEIRDTLRVHWLTDFFDDVRYAIRSLRRTPGLTAFIVVTISLGIGMTATPFSMLDALVFRPYPVPRSNDVVTLVGTSRDSAYENFSYREYLDIRRNVKSYDGVIANTGVSGVGFTADPKAPARVRAGILVSGNYFRVLGVEPKIGRSFRDDEDLVPGRDAVVVLGPDFWKREFGSDPSVVGRVVRVNGSAFTVIGVAPESFRGMFIFTQPELYFPLAMAKTFSTNPAKSFFDDRDDRELVLRGRIRRGAALGEARHELETLARNLAREFPKTNRGRAAAVYTLMEMRTRPDEGNWKFGFIFTVLSLAVLLVACTNAAGLLISRARTRTREIAVRLAIGASRFRLIRLLLTESLVLALFGGLGGIAVGFVGIDLLRRFRIPAELPVEIPFRMDSRVLLASLALSVLCAIFCGLAPALQSARTDLVHGFEVGRRRGDGKASAVGPQRPRRRSGRDIDDAPGRGVSHGARLPRQPRRGHRILQGAPAVPPVRPTPRAVHARADAAVLREALRTGQGPAGSPGRRVHEEPSTRAPRPGHARLRAGRIRDAARARELQLHVRHRGRGILRDAGNPDPARALLPAGRHG